ncbi:ASPIC/UnbV domain-containing protein [Micromonospora sp. M12]
MTGPGLRRGPPVGPPAFYRNDKPGDGNFLGLRLTRPTLTGDGTTPAYGAQVKLTTADGRTQLAQLDGVGHSGKRSFDVFFGLGDAGDRPVRPRCAGATWPAPPTGRRST